MLGVGILLTPPVVAASVPDLLGFFALWLAGAVVAACGGMVYAELGAMLPEAGGDVVFLRRAFGRTVALAVGTVIFVGAFAGSIASMAVAVCTYQLQTLLGTSVVLSEPVLAGVRGDQLLGAALVLGLTGVNALGARTSTVLQTLLTVVPLVGLALLALWGVAVGPWDLTPPAGQVHDLGNAWLGVYFAYAGWPAIVYVAGEVKDPGRTLPVAVLGGTALIAMLYGLLCLAFVAVLGFEGLASAGEAGTALARALLGETAAVGMAGLVALALLASVNGTVLGGARLAWAMADQLGLDGLTPLSEAGTPVRLLWVQAAFASVLALSGTFEVLMAWTSVAMLAAGSLVVLAHGWLRQVEPDLERPFRAWAHPLPALVYVVSSVVAIGMLTL